MSPGSVEVVGFLKESSSIWTPGPGISGVITRGLHFQPDQADVAGLVHPGPDVGHGVADPQELGRGHLGDQHIPGIIAVGRAGSDKQKLASLAVGAVTAGEFVAADTVAVVIQQGVLPGIIKVRGIDFTGAGGGKGFGQNTGGLKAVLDRLAISQFLEELGDEIFAVPERGHAVVGRVLGPAVGIFGLIRAGNDDPVGPLEGVHKGSGPAEPQDHHDLAAFRSCANQRGFQSIQPIVQVNGSDGCLRGDVEFANLRICGIRPAVVHHDDIEVSGISDHLVPDRFGQGGLNGIPGGLHGWVSIPPAVIIDVSGLELTVQEPGVNPVGGLDVGIQTLATNALALDDDRVSGGLHHPHRDRFRGTGAIVRGGAKHGLDGPIADQAEGKTIVFIVQQELSVDIGFRGQWMGRSQRVGGDDGYGDAGQVSGRALG